MAFMGYILKKAWSNRSYLVGLLILIHWRFGSVKQFLSLILFSNGVPWYDEEARPGLARWSTIMVSNYSALWLMWKLFVHEYTELHGANEVPSIVEFLDLFPTGILRPWFDAVSGNQSGRESTASPTLVLATSIISMFGLIKFGGYVGVLMILQGPLVFDLGLVSLITQTRAAFGESSLEDDSKLSYRHNPRWAWLALAQAVLASFTMFCVYRGQAWAHYMAMIFPVSANAAILLSLVYGKKPERMAESLPVISRSDEKSICHVCESTIFASLKIYPSWNTRSAVHHESVGSLRDSAIRGCRVCSAVWQWRTQVPRDFRGIVQFWLPATTYHINVEGFDVISEEMRIRGKYDCRFKLIQQAAFRRRLDYFPQSLPELSQHTKSFQSWLTVLTWLKLCAEEHVACHTRSPNTFVPSRLLYLGNISTTGTVCVHSKAHNDYDESTSYMTLSHCWGKGYMKKLRTRNQAYFRNGIQKTSLSKTFQDAISLAVILQQKYLWIDSLCIIQDDPKDWQREAPTMGNVYRNSFCNIAASDSSSGREGLFYPRDASTLRPEVVEVAEDRQNMASRVIVNQSDIYNDHILYTRAWVLQEAILAPRTIDCGRGQLFWRCAGLNASEVFRGGLPSGPEYRDHPASHFITTRLGGGSSILDAHMIEQHLGNNFLRHHNATPQAERSIDPGSNSPFSLWAIMVETFTGMNLTVANDRLVALSGIVDLFRPYLGTNSLDHLSGMWKCFMPLELLWSRNGISNHRRRPDVSTWSWLSVDFPVSYSRCSFEPGRGLDGKWGGDILLATFINAERMDHEPGKKDLVKLKVRAKVLKATWFGYWDEKDDGHPISSVQDQKAWMKFYGIPTLPDYNFGTIRFDDPLGEKPATQVWLLPIQIHHWYGDSLLQGLVLKKVSPNAFERIGQFEGPNQRLQAFINDATEEEVTLV